MLRRRAAANEALLNELLEGDKRERQEQEAAQVAALSCEFSFETIKKGLHNTVLFLRKKPKTKYEYNKERIRDVRINKGEREKKTPLDLTLDELTNRGKASYQLLQTDPSHFYREYKHEVFNSSIKQIHHKFSTFGNIQSLDLGNQLLGDERIEKLSDSLLRSPVTALNLSGNKLSDTGVACLCRCLRSLSKLKSLNLSWNGFGDVGVEKLTHDDYYSPSLIDLDLSYNILSPHAAYHIGKMLQKDRLSELAVLRLGGNAGRTGWGDRFLLTLLNAIVIQGTLSRIRALHIPDFSITSESIECITGLLLCDGLKMRILNISKNPITSDMLRSNLVTAITLQSCPVLVQAVDCCFTRVQLQAISAHANALYIPRDGIDGPASKPYSWLQLLEVAQIGLRGLNYSQYIYREVKQEVLNIFRTEMPLKWRNFVSDFSSDLLNSVAAATSTVSSKAIDILFPQDHHKNTMELLNDQVIQMFSLQDVYTYMQTKVVDDSGKEHKTLGHNSEATAIKKRMQIVQLEIDQLSNVYSIRVSECTRMVDRFVATSEVLFKEYAKSNNQYLVRKWGTPPPLDRTPMEQLQMTVEDTLSFTLEHSLVSQSLIACKYEMRLLRIALAQVSLSKSSMNYSEIVAKTVPCYRTLGKAALFTYYAYSMYHKDKLENQDKHVLNVS